MIPLTFKKWLEGLWLNDANAETTGTGVRAQRKSKPNTGGMTGMQPMGNQGIGTAGGIGSPGGLSLSPN
jgi:hypothetical protein